MERETEQPNKPICGIIYESHAASQQVESSFRKRGKQRKTEGIRDEPDILSTDGSAFEVYEHILSELA